MMKFNHTHKIIFVFFFSLLLNACKKEKLSSEYSYLYGKWNWRYTYRNHGKPDFAEFNPSTEGSNYSLEISKKCIVFYKNGKKEVKRYFKDISVHPGDTDTSVISFLIDLNKKDEMTISYYPNKNYVTFGSFPFDYINSGEIDVIENDGYVYKNFFQKE